MFNIEKKISVFVSTNYKIISNQITNYHYKKTFKDQILFILSYYRIDIREGISLPKNNNRKECVICRYWFFNHGLSFQDYVCNGSHDLSISSVNN